MELSKAYNSKEVEDKIYKIWLESGYFNPDKLATKGKPFVIMLPPPNITGSLHMGHALNAALSDLLIRWRRMQGYKTLWLPGTDHAGIAMQYVVEKELKKEGKTRFDLGREKFIERVWAWREKYGGIILDQLKKLGCSLDWSRTRFTLDPEYSQAVNTAFLHYYNKGLIYQAPRVVSWCKRCSTSLSDLEIEHEPEETELIYIKYPLADKSGYIEVATTRPETMLGDSAVAVNPKDDRYKKLVGKKVILPIQNREIPIVADSAVDLNFGTGAVKVTPAHDALDFEIGERHKLPIYNIINEDGRMTQTAKFCEGLKTLDCRKKVIEELEKEKLIVKYEKIKHNLAKCYRCGTTIEPLISNQWFLKMKDLAKKAIEAVKKGHVKFIPERFKKIYFDWLENIRDWTISRQIWWGHQLPIWVHDPICIPKPGKEKETGKCQDIIASVQEPKCQYCDAKYKQVNDVLDTWFSSALWPFATLGWPEATRDLKEFYPGNVLLTDRGIINLWVSRMIFSGLEFMKREPFQDVYIHATILTKEGKRMSKSLGTGLDPMDLIEKYGADAVRFGLIWMTFGQQDIRFSEEHILAGKKFANKLWNIARFITQQNKGDFGKLNWPKDELKSEDKELIKKISELIKTTNRYLENFEFGPALHELYEFIWHYFADKYIEFVKSSQTDVSKKILAVSLITILKLLHPFMPFITEEIYGKIPLADKKLLLVESWPEF